MSATPYNASDYLRTADDIAAYLDAAFEDGEPVVVLLALRQAVDAAGGISELARQTGLSREHLYTALSERGNPRLDTLLAILTQLNLRLSIGPRQVA